MLVCAFFDAHCTRDRGCSAHPVFPAPSTCLRVKLKAKLGHFVPRECGPIALRWLTRGGDDGDWIWFAPTRFAVDMTYQMVRSISKSGVMRSISRAGEAAQYAEPVIGRIRATRWLLRPTSCASTG